MSSPLIFFVNTHHRAPLLFYYCAAAPFWGHVVSKDLAHWTWLPPALLPDTMYDFNGVWSGAATMADGDVPVLTFTGTLRGTIHRRSIGHRIATHMHTIAHGSNHVHRYTARHHVMQDHLVPDTFTVAWIYIDAIAHMPANLHCACRGVRIRHRRRFSMLYYGRCCYSTVDNAACAVACCDMLCAVPCDHLPAAATTHSPEMGNYFQRQAMAVPADLNDPYLKKWVKPTTNPFLVQVGAAASRRPRAGLHP